jgi:putative FmdB family regulatory protein
MPVYEYTCRACGHLEEHLQPLGAGPPGPCSACGGELRRRWSRVAVKYQDWGFTATDKLLPDDRRQRHKDYRALRERAERIADGES